MLAAEFSIPIACQSDQLVARRRSAAAAESRQDRQHTVFIIDGRLRLARRREPFVPLPVMSAHFILEPSRVESMIDSTSSIASVSGKSTPVVVVVGGEHTLE